MATYISVPRNLIRVKSKVLFNLTERQPLCFEASALAGVPAFLLLKQSGNVSLAAIDMMIIALPMFFLGMYEKRGQPLEAIAKQFIEARFIHPRVRSYQINNYYTVLIRQAQVEQEVQRIAHSEKQKKTDRTQRDGSAGHSSKTREKADSLYRRKGEAG